MNKRAKDKPFSPDVREFLAEVGEALRDHLERMHQARGIIPLTPMEDEDSDESGRVFPSQR